MNSIINYIKNKIGFSPDLAIILGSGLSGLQNILNNKIIIKYSDIPEYFRTTVKGHDGKFVFGSFKNKYILMAVGRFHYYEGLSLNQVGLPIRIFDALKCKNIIITNSSGCLQRDWDLGDVMIIDGHYDFTFRKNTKNPILVEGNDYYNNSLINLTINNNPKVRLGKYGWVLGPMYETKSEILNMKEQGVNAVGMSTIPEVLMAKKLKIKILALALMSNYAVGLTSDNLNHNIVLKNSIKYNQNFELLLIKIISEI
tara:strand:- start:1849 stop:2616 length:768 start_codon:yes stop_codon:yes gene_type:complete